MARYLRRGYSAGNALRLALKEAEAYWTNKVPDDDHDFAGVRRDSRSRTPKQTRKEARGGRVEKARDPFKQTPEGTRLQVGHVLSKRKGGGQVCQLVNLRAGCKGAAMGGVCSITGGTHGCDVVTSSGVCGSAEHLRQSHFT